MKTILSFCLLLTLACVVLSNHVKFSKGNGGKLLYRVDVVRPAIQGFAQDVYVAYPRDGEKNINEEIINICIYDKHPDLSGALPVLAYDVEKDLNDRLETATVILRGKVSAAINSTVEFYGKE